MWCGVCGNGLARGKCLGTAGLEVSYWVCVSECVCGVVCVEMGWQGGNVWELLA